MSNSGDLRGPRLAVIDLRQKARMLRLFGLSLQAELADLSRKELGGAGT